ncbi:MAG: hypothetical protein JWP87_2166 [Labilithrix sp.]|nr:hypothetical protein [Labilithrix sp.]
MDSPAAISDDLATFLESGISVVVGSRDAQRRPAAMRAAGAVVSADRRSVTVFLPDQNAARTLDNLRDNGRIAVTFSRPSDHRSIQVKGSCVELRPATEDERARRETYVAAFVDELATVGMARENTGRLTSWPSVAVRVEVEEVFDQTPGPAAGQKLGRTA